MWFALAAAAVLILLVHTKQGGSPSALSPSRASGTSQGSSALVPAPPPPTPAVLPVSHVGPLPPIIINNPMPAPIVNTPWLATVVRQNPAPSPIPPQVLNELASSGYQPITPGSNVAAADQTGHDVVAAKLAQYSSQGPTVAQQAQTNLVDANSFNLAGTPDAYFDNGGNPNPGGSGIASDIIATDGGAFR